MLIYHFHKHLHKILRLIKQNHDVCDVKLIFPVHTKKLNILKFIFISVVRSGKRMVKFRHSTLNVSIKLKEKTRCFLHTLLYVRIFFKKYTLSTNLDTILITLLPASPGSASSKPDSASALSDSATLQLN